MSKIDVSYVIERLEKIVNTDSTDAEEFLEELKENSKNFLFHSLNNESVGTLVKADVFTSKDLDLYKSGIFDAVVHGNKDDDKRCHHYKQGYDYGLGIVQELNIQGACFLEGAE